VYLYLLQQHGQDVITLSPCLMTKFLGEGHFYLK